MLPNHLAPAHDINGWYAAYTAHKAAILAEAVKSHKQELVKFLIAMHDHQHNQNTYDVFLKQGAKQKLNVDHHTTEAFLAIGGQAHPDWSHAPWEALTHAILDQFNQNVAPHVVIQPDHLPTAHDVNGWYVIYNAHKAAILAEAVHSRNQDLVKFLIAMHDHQHTLNTYNVFLKQGAKELLNIDHHLAEQFHAIAGQANPDWSHAPWDAVTDAVLEQFNHNVAPHVHP